MAVQGLAQQAGFGFRLMISSGNEAVLGVTDYLEALIDDDKTDVIAVYLEGVRDGVAFAAALARARRIGKPIVMLKAGLTAEAGRAAAAHTGALVGDDRVWQSVFRDEAVISVRSMRELVDVALSSSAATAVKRCRAGGALRSFRSGAVWAFWEPISARATICRRPPCPMPRDRTSPAWSRPSHRWRIPSMSPRQRSSLNGVPNSPQRSM